jgi:O-antigen ligase
MFVHRYSVSRNVGTKVNVVSLVKSALLMGAVAFVVAEGYGYAAGEGWLGEESKQKYEAQAGGKFGVLLGGRVELFASTLAIIDSPLIGHGSWAKDPKYATGLLEQLAAYDYEIPREIKTDLIPTHSYLFGAWVESGIVGAIFWLWVLFFVFKILLILHKTKDTLVPLVAFVGFEMLWNVLFSPFGAGGRVYVAYHLVLLMFVWARSGGSVRV